MRGGRRGEAKKKKKKRKNNRENRKTGQDADICKRSDTDLEKASSSGWLMNRGVKLPCGSQSMGKSPAHWLNLYISVVNVYCSLKPGDYWNTFCFLYVLLSLPIFFAVGELIHLDLGSWRLEHYFSLSRGCTVVTKLCPWLSWRVPEYSSCCFAVSHCPLLKLEATVASYETEKKKTFCHVNVLHSLNLRCTFV